MKTHLSARQTVFFVRTRGIVAGMALLQRGFARRPPVFFHSSSYELLLHRGYFYSSFAGILRQGSVAPVCAHGIRFFAPNKANHPCRKIVGGVVCEEITGGRVRGIFIVEMSMKLYSERFFNDSARNSAAEVARPPHCRKNETMPRAAAGAVRMRRPSGQVEPAPFLFPGRARSSSERDDVRMSGSVTAGLHGGATPGVEGGASSVRAARVHPPV